ncbi:MAG: alpha/beta hydrolase [Defluviitaleaceae bacterium]|nr:alpha/beta hydrolase [Defluviitaleaceae bacterium]
MKKYDTNMVTLPTRNEKIAYRKGGTAKEHILLIHGNMSSSVHWQTTIEDLEKDFSVYAPDLRGFGESSYNASFDSLKCLAEDLNEFINEVNIGNLTVIGWSTGGGVALELCALCPSVVKKVITIGSVPVTGYPIFKKDEQGVPIVTELLKTKAEIANDPVQVLPVLNAYENKDRGFIRLILDNALYSKAKPSDAEYEAYIDAILQQRCLVDTNYALLTFNITNAVSKSTNAPGSNHLDLIKCPIVMLQGADDLVVPLAWAKESHAIMADKADFMLLEGLGHSVMTDNFSVFIQKLRKALL